MFYIQRKDSRFLETIDEFSSYREARKMLAEYIMSDPSARYYISSRACREWIESGQSCKGETVQ